MITAAASTKSDDDTRSRAARLVDEAFVFNTTEAPASFVDGKHIMNFTGLAPLHASMVADWRRQGLNAVLVPQGMLDPANMCPVADPINHAMKVFGRWNTFVAEHAGDMQLLTTPASFELAQASGRIGLLVGTHNAGEIFRTVDDVDFFYNEVGLRHGLLTCFGQNRLGTSADEGDGRDGGLTRFGRTIVERMNAVGMAVDVSHCGLKTRRETFDASSKPVLITHGNVAAICPSSRNNSDEMLQALAAAGGVVGIMFWRPMVRLEDPVTVEHVLDHFDHVCQLIGPRHVGLGLETPMVGFDACENSFGPARQVSYLKDVRSMDIPELCGHERVRTLVAGLIRRGYRDEDIIGILGGNFVRVFKEIFTPGK
ncbi:MAG: membrane dipeptidase [Gammaproteobacteria bacterium]|nr:membrane dipeptidase [Gammaproteobacteria bacterium]